jgi:hypothetical protein
MGEKHFDRFDPMYGTPALLCVVAQTTRPDYLGIPRDAFLQGDKMGQAFDREGNVLGEAEGATKREVFEKLDKAFKDAVTIRIVTMEQRMREAEEAAKRGTSN